MIQIETNSESETRQLGQRLGQQLQPGMLLGLDGTLGTGKTRLVQGIGLGLGIAEDSIVSPTYTIFIPYRGTLELVHVDAYRIKDVSELDELGLDEWLESGAVLAIEWAERISEYLPPIDIQIRLEHIGDKKRKMTLQSLPQHRARLSALADQAAGSS